MRICEYLLKINSKIKNLKSKIDLALSLFMLRVLADNANSALAADNLAIFTNLFCACSYFHMFTEHESCIMYHAPNNKLISKTKFTAGM